MAQGTGRMAASLWLLPWEGGWLHLLKTHRLILKDIAQGSTVKSNQLTGRLVPSKPTQTQTCCQSPDQHPAGGDFLETASRAFHTGAPRAPRSHGGRRSSLHHSWGAAVRSITLSSPPPTHALPERLLWATVTRPRPLKQTQDNGSRCCVHETPNSGK